MLRKALPAFALPWLAVPAAAWAQQGEPYYDRHMWDGGWHGVVGPFFMLFFLVAAVVAVVLVVRWLGPPQAAAGPADPGGKSPLDILKERFARGEIDRQEFEERRRVLAE